MPTAMQRRMSWVRSFQRNRRRRRSYSINRRRRHYRRNPYPMAGAVTSLAAGNPRRRHYRSNRRRHYYTRNRRYRRNPGRVAGFIGRGLPFGLPSLKTVGWAVAGFSGTAAIQTMLWGATPGQGLIPSTWTLNADGTPSTLAKYGILLASVAITHLLVRMFQAPQAGTATIGGSLYAAGQAIHDFLPGVVPGMRAYTPLHAYTPLRAYHRWGMPQLASQNIGATNLPVGWAPNGAMDIVAQRLRRFN